MVTNEDDPIYKLTIHDLHSFEKNNETWNFRFDKDSRNVPVYQFQIQGTVSRVSGLDNEILIIDDETGKAKVTRGPTVPGDFSWLKPGVYCSLIGTLLENGKLPHISVVKLAEVNNEILKKTWPIEVKELKDLMNKRIIPDLVPVTISD